MNRIFSLASSSLWRPKDDCNWTQNLHTFDGALQGCLWSASAWMSAVIPIATLRDWLKKLAPLNFLCVLIGSLDCLGPSWLARVILCLTIPRPHRHCARGIWKRRFTLKTYQMFFVHITSAEFNRATIAGHFGFVFEENSVEEISLLSWRHNFRKSRVSKCFSFHTKTKSRRCFNFFPVCRAFSKSSVFVMD